MCNDQPNCPNGEDELFCHPILLREKPKLSFKCSIIEFMCVQDLACIPLSRRCNGHKDCVDGSDEQEPCRFRNISCAGFLCANKQCLPDPNQQCDDKYDCSDASDEINCSK